MGAPHLRPRVPDDRSRRGCARRVPGDLPPRISRAPRVPGAGKVLVLAVSDRAEPLPRLGAPPAPYAGRPGAGGHGPDGACRRPRAVGIDRGPRCAQSDDEISRAGDGAPARRAADGDCVEGISRAHLSGNRRPGRVPTEHGENAVVSGTHGLAARAGACRSASSRAAHIAMADTLCAFPDRDDVLVTYLYDDMDTAARATFDSHLAICA